jgi:hypothetical protein
MKSLFFGLLLLTVCETTYGQTNMFDIGIEGSPSIVFLHGNDFIEKYHKPTIRFTGGFFFQFNFKKIVSLRTNITFERKGSIVPIETFDNNGNQTGDYLSKAYFNYLTLPVLVRATFGKKVQFFVNAGPYLGYLIQQTVIFSGDNVITTTTDNTSHFKRIDIGLSTGLGLSIPMQKRFAFSFEVRNNLGLYNISALPVMDDQTIKTNAINFLFGFAYKLGHRD